MAQLKEMPTTAAVQRYLDVLAVTAGTAPVDPVIRDLLERSAHRLHQLCASLLHRHYRRLLFGPTNLCPEELLSAVVERLIKALHKIRPGDVRQFFALANQHMRWELNDVARRLDETARVVQLHDSVAGPSAELNAPSAAGPKLRRILDAIGDLPEEERDAFNLVRIGGMTHAEAAAVAGCSERTMQRRLSRSLMLLTATLGDLRTTVVVELNAE